MASPVGELTLVASEQGLRAVLWAEERVGRVMLPERQGDPAHAILTEAVRQLTEYFAGSATCSTCRSIPSAPIFRRRCGPA
ncbi:hypothetical protein GCM10020258_14960 [Sphingomonas yabuuchiae]